MPSNADIALKIAQYLRGHQDESGSLWDEHDQAMTPVSHYGLSYYAVAALLLHKRTGDLAWLKSGTKALENYFARRTTTVIGHDRGHKEFNDLALLYCLQALQQLPGEQQLADLIGGYVRHEVPDNGDPHSRMPNNWMAMRAVCCLIKGNSYPGSAGKNGRWLIDRYILRCQQPDGFFYDMPAVPGLPRGETPLTYHAKVCAMLAMGYEYHATPAVARAVVRGLDTLSAFLAPDAETFYFGRTNNGLFGYASAVYAFTQAAAVIPMADEVKSRYQAVAGNLLGYIAKRQRPDGHVAIAPNTEEAQRTGWDEYMHTAVYNAYAAAMLLMAGPIASNDTDNSRKGISFFNDAGLVSLRAPDDFVAAATQGQSVNKSMTYGNARYKGINIYKLWHAGRDLVAPPGINDAEWSDISLKAEDGSIHACSETFTHVRCRAGDSFLIMTGEGLVKKQDALSIMPKTGHHSLATAINRSLERMLPQEILWWLDRMNLSRRAARHGNGTRCYRSLLLDLDRHWLCTANFMPSLPCPGSITCAITPPLCDDSFVLGVWASVPESGQQRARRGVRSSKGTVPQEYLRIACPEPGKGCWTLGVYSWTGHQVRCVQNTPGEMVLDDHWTVRFNAAGIEIEGQ